MFKHILVPLDGSTRAEKAVPIAARIARTSGGSITLLYVVTPPVQYDLIGYEQHITKQTVHAKYIAEAKDYLTSIAAFECLEGIGVRTEVEIGAPGLVILERSLSLPADLITMCSHGRTGFTRWMLGSVALKVAHHSPVPVLILRETFAHAASPTQVLLALDGSKEAEEALLPAAQLSAALAAPAQGMLHIVCVLHPPHLHDTHVEEMIAENEREMQRIHTYLAEVEQRLHNGDLANLNLAVTSSVTIDSDVTETLVRIAEIGCEPESIEGCSLIAMAAHTPDSLLKRIMGSITDQVLNGTRLPMLIVRAHTADEHIASTAEEVYAPV